MRRLPLLVLTLAYLLLSATAARSYSWYYCDSDPDDAIQWQTTPTMRLAADGFSGFDTQSFALIEVFGAWNDSPADFEFDYQFGDESQAKGNGQSEIWFTDALAHGAKASTRGECSGNARILEADVRISTNEIFAADLSSFLLNSYAGEHRSLHTLTMHELGHALGLGHEDGVYNVMGYDGNHLHANGKSWTASGRYLEARPGENAAHGAVFLYGADAGAGEDLGVSHWAYSHSDGTYSQHRRTGILDEDDEVLPAHWVDGEPVYHVTRGETVQLELTFENAGLSDHDDVSVDFVLSGNAHVSAATDEWLASATPDLHRNTPYTRLQSLTIPADLSACETYWLGAVVDPDDGLAEVSEWNNATYVAIRTDGCTDPDPGPFEPVNPYIDPPTVPKMIDEAQLVFTGRITGIDYRLSKIRKKKHVELPHTFVTLEVDQILKGRVANDADTLTLRFEGGLDPRNDRTITFVEDTPLFDLGRSILLFVEGNGTASCPVVRDRSGVFRFVTDPSTGLDMAYSDPGREVWLTREGELAFGARHVMPEIHRHQFGRHVVSEGFSDAAGEHGPSDTRPPGRRLTAADLVAFVKELVGRRVDDKELRKLESVPSADPDAPFFVERERAKRPHIRKAHGPPPERTLGP